MAGVPRRHLTTSEAWGKQGAGSRPQSRSGRREGADWDCSAITSSHSDLNIQLRVLLPVIIVT